MYQLSYWVSIDVTAVANQNVKGCYNATMKFKIHVTACRKPSATPHVSEGKGSVSRVTLFFPLYKKSLEDFIEYIQRGMYGDRLLLRIIFGYMAL